MHYTLGWSQSVHNAQDYQCIMVLTWDFIEEPLSCSRVSLNVMAVSGPVEVGYKTRATPAVADMTIMILDTVNINKIVVGADS